jgi:isocitrate lyase
LMTLMHFFLLHRYKTDLVHYVTPTDDNRLSVSRMIQNGVFRGARTDDPNIIALGVDTARAQKIFANDDSLKRFITNEFRPPKGRSIHPLMRAVG